jgi:hypothetical protein
MGHTNKVNSLKFKNNMLLSGSQSNAILVHDLIKGDKNPSNCYNYHREPVLDLCWLNSTTNLHENSFVSVASDGVAFMYLFYLFEMGFEMRNSEQ